MHEQKFKDLNSACLTSSERRLLESYFVRDLGSISTGGSILSLDFCIHAVSKDENANIWHFRLVCEKLVCRNRTISILTLNFIQSISCDKDIVIAIVPPNRSLVVLNISFCS